MNAVPGGFSVASRAGWRLALHGEIFSPGLIFEVNSETGQTWVQEPVSVLNEPIELTVFTKARSGLMSKVLGLAADGTLVSDGSYCLMSDGTANRLAVSGVADLAEAINLAEPYHAIALGRMKPGTPRGVSVVTDSELPNSPGAIARTRKHFEFAPGLPAFLLIDVDTKGMSSAARAKVDACGGFWPALCQVIPELSDCARVVRPSTSSWVGHMGTGKWLSEESGLHYYIVIRDGSDTERFLKDFSARCWLAGLGWWWINKAGSFLDRSLVDAKVGTPEHLVFEGAPWVSPPLFQSQEKRKATHVDGDLLDSRTACPPLTTSEQEQANLLMTQDKARVAPDAAIAAAKYEADVATRIANAAGRAEPSAADRDAAKRSRDGVLLGAFVLQFDKPELAGKTVADVLADPARYIGETLADPIEGRAYGTGKAKILKGRSGRLFVNSFAHGGITYDLFLDEFDRDDTGFTAEIPPDWVDVEALTRPPGPTGPTGKAAFDAEVAAVNAEEAASKRKEWAKKFSAVVVYDEDTDSLPPLEWLVDGFLPKVGVAQVYGKYGTFKTFITQSLSLHIANGAKQWGAGTLSTAELSLAYLARARAASGCAIRRCAAPTGSHRGKTWCLSPSRRNCRTRTACWGWGTRSKPRCRLTRLCGW